MGKSGGRRKRSVSRDPRDAAKEKTVNPNAPDDDTETFTAMALELKEEGNKLFQRRDHEGALLKYEKAVKLLPKAHPDVPYLRSNMAACYMQMGLGEYPMAINECNKALEVCPGYSKALLKRAKCYEALNRLDLAYKDVDMVLSAEANNLTALEIAQRVRSALEKKGIKIDADGFTLDTEFIEIPCVSFKTKSTKEKTRKKKNNKAVEEKKVEDKVVVEESKENNEKNEKFVRKEEKSSAVEKNLEVKSNPVEKNLEEKSNTVEKNLEEKSNSVEKNLEEKTNTVEKNLEEKSNKVEDIIKPAEKEEAKRNVKLVFGDDKRWVQLPVDCSIQRLKETVRDRFPSLKAFVVKYKDHEGDLISITSTEELKWADTVTGPQGSLKLYIVDTGHGQEMPLEVKKEVKLPKIKTQESNIVENGNVGGVENNEEQSFYIDDWIVQFSRVFKNHVGFNSDAYLDLHEVGMKLYTDAMEDTVTCEKAQCLFDISAEKFQEMAALAFFNWGNVHMSKARKKVVIPEDASRETVLAQVNTAYDWAQKEFINAGMRYAEASKIKPDFYEAFLALGQQEFEQARLSWYYAIATQLDLDEFPSTEILQLYNNAEKNMEEGMQIWEEMEEQRLGGLSTPAKRTIQQQKVCFNGLATDMTLGEQASNMRSQVNILWGTILYERSVVEFKLGLPSWEECLEVSVEKFELAGASPTDIAVMIKNHCANQSSIEGFGFKIDEIVQAWNEMYDARRWKRGVPSFRLEPLFRRRVPNLHHVLEHV